MVWANPSRYPLLQVIWFNIVNRPPEASFALPAFIMILFIHCRFRGQPGLRRRGSGGEDVVLLRLPGGPDPHRLRPLTLSLHGGDPGGAAVRWPVETLPRHWHRNDHHKGRKVNLLLNVKNLIYGGEVQHIRSDSGSIFQKYYIHVSGRL